MTFLIIYSTAKSVILHSLTFVQIRIKYVSKLTRRSTGICSLSGILSPIVDDMRSAGHVTFITKPESFRSNSSLIIPRLWDTNPAITMIINEHIVVAITWKSICYSVLSLFKMQSYNFFLIPPNFPLELWARFLFWTRKSRKKRNHLICIKIINAILMWY